MGKVSGVLHIYQTPKREEAAIFGDEEGLCRLWLAVGEALLPKTRLGSVRLERGKLREITIFRVDKDSHFLKQFPMNP